MKQEEVKIIGIKIKHKLGILQACELKFNEENDLIAIHGEVGSGKSTFTKALRLGTQGGKILKDDKKLYGKVNQEVQLLDGDTPVFIGCKSDSEGALVYSIYTKDENGKVNKTPIIGGVKATPATYLDALQTSLTWRMNELTSANSTVQKKILLDLYKKELAQLGVVYDKKSSNYEGSILDKIDKAEADRTTKDVLRKQVSGFANHLKDNGYDVEKPDTLPTRVDITTLQNEKADIEFNIKTAKNNIADAKEKKLNAIRLEASKVIEKMHELNETYRTENIRICKAKDEITDYNSEINIAERRLNEIFDRLIEITSSNELADLQVNVIEKINSYIKEQTTEDEFKLLTFEKNQCTVKSTDEGYSKEAIELVKKIEDIRERFTAQNNAPLDEVDTTAEEKQLEEVNKKIETATDINKVCDSIDAFYEWQEADRNVQKLKDEYSKKLASIDTGVSGLLIKVEDEDIYLYYNGEYDPNYFNNPKKEFRKLSSYSETQKPMICLLIQNHLLSLKTKAMRYLWIDDVPIDNKTKALLEKMCKELNLTLFVNITGDFDESTLKDGEMLIIGGELFFNTEKGMVSTTVKEVEEEKEEMVVSAAKPKKEKEPKEETGPATSFDDTLDF